VLTAWPAVAALALALSVTQLAPPGVTAAPRTNAAAAARRTTVTLIGAGDIASCSSGGDEATARMLAKRRGTIFTTGDNAYPDGRISEFHDCYHPSWGQHRKRTRPSPGNHDYHVPDARGYFAYFDWRAGPEDRGYYVYRRGMWRIYSLNSEVLSGQQLQWLRGDLRRHTPACSLAYWHAPLFSSGQHGNNSDIRKLWDPLYRAGVDVVINGHDHHYERFAPMRPDGTRSPRGIRQFIVGTGGAALRAAHDVKRHSRMRYWDSHGLLRLRLAPGGYSWRFITVREGVVDSGRGSCHGRP
jgi:hypothetical protein